MSEAPRRNHHAAAKFRTDEVNEALETVRVLAPAIYAGMSAADRANHAEYVRQRFAYLAEGGTVTDMSALIRRAAGRDAITQHEPEETPE